MTDSVTDSAAPDPQFSKPEGTIIADHFRIEAELGGGGMSIVYKCLDTQLGRTVAVKEMQPDRLADDRSHRRFHQEAKAVGRLNHPNIVRLHGFEVVDDTPYIVMDYIEGMPLSQWLGTNGKLSEEKSLEIVLQVAAALEHAHEKAIVHRDLKPANIMLRQDGSVVLVDFGIAKLTSTVASIKATQTGEVFGSPAYMSPEQVSGRVADATTDQYALGCILFECLTGRPPFVGRAPLEVMFQHLNDAPPNATLYLKRPADPIIEKIIKKLLQKEPANRFADMAQVRRSLLQAKDSLATTSDNLAAAKQHRLPHLPPVYAQKFPAVVCVMLIAIVGLAISLAVSHLYKPVAQGAPRPETAKPMAVQTATKLHAADQRRQIQDWIEKHKKAGFLPILASRPTNDPGRLTDAYTTDDVFTITDADLESLCDLHGLTIIDLQGCENLTGAGLSKLDGRNVTEISCKDTRFTDDDLKCLAHFPKLQSLNLASTRITNKGLAMLPSLAPNLNYLVINSCSQLTDNGFAPLLKLPHLQTLDLRQVAIGAKGVKCLGKCNLLGIRLGGTGVSDEDLKVIAQDKKLQALSLDSCDNIKGSGFRYLTALGLQELDIGECKLSSGTLLAFRKAVPNCKLLNTRTKFDAGKVPGLEDLIKP